MSSKLKYKVGDIVSPNVKGTYTDQPGIILTLVNKKRSVHYIVGFNDGERRTFQAASLDRWRTVVN